MGWWSRLLRRRAGGGRAGINPPPSQALPAPAPEPASAMAPQAPDVEPEPPEPAPDPTGPLSADRLDRALDRLRKEIPASSEETSPGPSA